MSHDLRQHAANFAAVKVLRDFYLPAYHRDTQGIVTPPLLMADWLDGASRTAYVW